MTDIDRAALDRELKKGAAELDEPADSLVGVVGDVRSMGAGTPAPPTIYVPFAQCRARTTKAAR